VGLYLIAFEVWREALVEVTLGEVVDEEKGLQHGGKEEQRWAVQDKDLNSFNFHFAYS
jgi:hypothetical protein